MRFCPHPAADKTAGGIPNMTKQELTDKEKEERLKRLKEQIDAIIGEFQGDIAGLRFLGGSKHYFDGACDELFDAVEKAYLTTVQHTGECAPSNEDLELFGDLSWGIAEFLEEVAPARIKLDALVLNKCEELVKGSDYLRWKGKRGGRLSAHRAKKQP